MTDNKKPTTLRRCENCSITTDSQAPTCALCGGPLQPPVRDTRAISRVWPCLFIFVLLLGGGPFALERFFPGIVTIDRAILSVRVLLLAGVIPALFLLRYLLDNVTPPADRKGDEQKEEFRDPFERPPGR